jgi:hypothetical protein
MTPIEQNELVRDQHTAGLDNGRALARIIIKQFPDGFTSDVAGEIRKITDKALAHVIDALTANDIEQKYRQPYAEGFNVGLAETYSEYASECAARALRTKQIG